MTRRIRATGAARALTMIHAFDRRGPRLLAMTLAWVVAGLAGCGGGSGTSSGSNGSSGSDGSSGSGTPSSFTISGTVSGLASGQQLSLVLNGNTASAVVVNANTSYTLGSVAAHGDYAVTVGTQPAGQVCTVSHGSGSGVTANVSDVAVTCSNTPAPTPASTHWANVKFGGGGYVPGLISDDAGATWTRINDDAHQWGGIGALAADNNVAGRVYLAARGVLYNY